MAFWAVVATLAAALVLVLACPLSRRLATLGAVSGAMFGLWVIVPMVFDRYRIYDLGAGAVLLVILPLVVAHAVVGYLLLGAAALPRAALWLVNRRTSWKEEWLVGLAYVALPLLYVGAAVVAHVLNTAQPPIADVGWVSIATGTAGYIVVSISAVAYASSQASPPAMRLAVRRVTVFGMAAALVVVGFRRPDEPVEAPPRSSSGDANASSAAPLLVIGLDGANWRVIDRAIASGAVPTLAHLKADGAAGIVRAASEPYWSAPSWASIVTGHEQARHGIYQNLGVTLFNVVPAQLELAPSPILSLVNLGVWCTLLTNWSEPAIFDRAHLRAAPVWERLTETNLTVGVVRFPFTYPARGQTAMTVADRIQPNLWRWIGVLPGDRAQVVWPPALATIVLKELDTPGESLATDVERAMGGTDGPLPIGVEVAPQDVAWGEVVNTGQTFNAALQMLQYDKGADAVFVFVGGLDLIGHANWLYQFPDDFPGQSVSSNDVDRLGDLDRRYLSYFDARLAELIGSFPTPPNVLIVSDHGMRAVPNHPVWKAWHSADGLFLASGPDVRHTAESATLEHLDIVPIIYDLLKLGRPSDLAGQGSLATPPPSGPR